MSIQEAATYIPCFISRPGYRGSRANINLGRRETSVIHDA